MLRELLEGQQLAMTPAAPAHLYHNDTIPLRQILLSGGDEKRNYSITNETPGMLRWKNLN